MILEYLTAGYRIFCVVNFSLLRVSVRAPRSETKLIVNTTGVFIKGVTTFNINDPDSGVQLFSSGNPEVTVNENLNSLNARVS